MTEISGQPVLISVDNQMVEFDPDGGIPVMPGYEHCLSNSIALVEAARAARIPVIFTQDRHSRTLVDFGRELDGVESIHCVEDHPSTELVDQLRPQPDEYLVTKRRYSAFFGTDLDVLLRGLGAETLILCGGLTDVCIHYTFVDAHQRDYHLRVATDGVIGSSEPAHRAALSAMEYLQLDALVASREIVTAFGTYDGPPRPGVAGARQPV
ncbi:MAG TPA: isochorismatase family cysteine hydrolase [Thermoleophilaceae bacterium]|nr:isochorismatase family cysteine hydrolase [Thermoleophilaceae bacterium]